MKNKNVYLTIAIIAILIVSIVAYIGISNRLNFTGTSQTTSTTPTPTSPQTTTSPTATVSPSATPSSTVSASPTTTPISTSSGATPSQQTQVTFTAAGLDSTANSSILFVSGAGNLTYAQLPYSMSVNSGSEVYFSYQANVTTIVPNCLFTLSQAPSYTYQTITGPTTINATYSKAVIDYIGDFVKLPSQINHIADSWPAHNTIIVMCGDGNKLVATSPTDTTITMFQYILPAMKTMSAPFDSSGNPNMEQLLADNPDIVFMSYSASTNSAYQTMVSAGLCVVRLYFATFPDMLSTVQQTGWILGQNELVKANNYISYFTQVEANITAVTSQIPQSQKLTVYHISGTSPLYCDGANSLIDTWITTCGGINAASSVSGNMQQVTLEQVLSWNPQVILIGSATATSIQQQILTNSQWSQVSAVANGKVIVNPMGVFDWSRYSVEEALNLQWVAKTLYPNLFTNIDIAAQTKYFYQTFYGYTLSDAQVTAILNNTTPPPQ